MAADTDAIAADAVDLQFEAMRKDDCSWHPCQVHLSPDGAGLVIEYGNSSSKDILVNEKEALTHLRVRSLPLQDDDCTHIKEGDHVVVNRNSESESCFFDAEVEKVARVRHSKRTGCRCTFVIKWLHQDLRAGSLTVPSSSLMRLTNESITNHPTVSAFIDAVPLSNSSFSCMSPQLNVVSDIDLDLHDLLEKQIEGIRNSVNGSKKIRDEILGFEANTEQVKETGVAISKVKEQEIQISTNKTRVRRSNRQKTEVKQSTSPANVIPVEEELPDNRSPLNPLAARAALASLMSKLPRSLDYSLDDEKPKGLTANNKLSPETKSTPKPLFSTSNSSKVTSKKVNGVPDDDIERTKNKSRRLTRSLLNKASEGETTETTRVVDKDMSTKREESTPSTRRNFLFKMEEENKGSTKSASNTRRLTRSVVNKVVETETVKETEGVLDVDMLKTKGGKKRVAKTTEETDGRSTNCGNDSPPTEKRNKKRNTCGDAITTQDLEGNGSKKNSLNSKKHEVRSSPRLTRSQNKA